MKCSSTQKPIFVTNISAIVEYSLAMPGTNAPVGSIVSTIYVLRTDENNRFSIKTIKAMTVKDIRMFRRSKPR